MALMSSFLQGGEVFMALAGWGGLHGSNELQGGEVLQCGEVFMALMSSYLQCGL